MIYIHCILSGSTVSGMSIPAQVVICHVAYCVPRERDTVHARPTNFILPPSLVPSGEYPVCREDVDSAPCIEHPDLLVLCGVRCGAALRYFSVKLTSHEISKQNDKTASSMQISYICAVNYRGRSRGLPVRTIHTISGGE